MTAADAAATIHSQFSQETTDQAADVAAEAELHGHQIDAGTDAETATVTAITAGR